MHSVLDVLVAARTGKVPWNDAARAASEVVSALSEAPFPADPGLRSVTPGQALLEEVAISASAEMLGKVSRGLDPTVKADNVSVFLSSLSDRLEKSLGVKIIAQALAVDG